MKLLFMTAHGYLPQMYGGLLISTDQLCRSLLQRGHGVAVLSGFMHNGLFAWKCSIQKKILRRKVSRDTVLAYPVWRSWLPWNEVEFVAKKERPDLIVVASGEIVRMALAAKQTGTPILVDLRDVLFEYHGGPFEALGSNVPCVVNSLFTADRYRRAYGVNPTVIYPLISPERYRTKTTRENVTFVNPHPFKGRHIALEVARLCPEIPFSVIEAWPLSTALRQELVQKLSVLPNASLSPPQKNMRNVYGRCKILLVPSVWEETYGRVVTEAQISGIPVVASRRGGLPEAVGPGGILLDPDGPIEDWVTAVRKLWLDDQYYAELSAAALAYAERDENSLSRKLDLWEQTLLAAYGGPLSSSAASGVGKNIGSHNNCSENL
jgi:glycosyltransferase involved in cell wall biosynthesis